MNGMVRVLYQDRRYPTHTQKNTPLHVLQIENQNRVVRVDVNYCSFYLNSFLLFTSLSTNPRPTDPWAHPPPTRRPTSRTHGLTDPPHSNPTEHSKKKVVRDPRQREYHFSSSKQFFCILFSLSSFGSPPFSTVKLPTQVAACFEI